MNLLGPETPSLEGRRLVKKFAESLRGMAEAERLPESSFETWGECFAEGNMTLEEAEWLGNWYSMYHKRSPSLGYIMHALRRLRAEGELPEHMIAGSEDLLAQKIIKFLHDEGASGDNAVNSLFMAAALSHVAYYRKHHPSIDRVYLRTELEGKARVSDWLVDQVLDEVEAGVGDLKALKPILFP